MDFGTLVITLAVFGLMYQGVGMFLESRQTRTSWAKRSDSQERPFSLKGLITKLSQAGFNKALLRNKKFYDSLDTILVRSGHVFGWKAEDLLFMKEFGAAFGLFLGWDLSPSQPLIWLLGAVLGFLLPEFYVKGKGTERMAQIQRQLPGFIDLIALTLESGLDLMAAVERIISKMKPSALREELQTMVQENRLGTPRKEIFQHLAFRAPISDIQSLSSMIIQSEELGTSLATVLRSYAEDMRNRRILRAEEIAGKAPVKILFPMMVFFFPIVFVIIFGPLALSFMNNGVK